MYLLVDQDGTVTSVDDLPEYVSWDCWPKAIKIELYSGPDVSAFVLSKDGWEEI